MKMDKDILDIIHKKQDRNYIYYIKPTDMPFKIFKWIYYIVFIYNFVFSCFTVFARYYFNFVAERGQSTAPEDVNPVRDSIIVLSVFVVLFLVGYILTVCKKFLPGLIINSFSIIGLSIGFFRIMSEQIDLNGYLKYILFHGAPLLLCLIFALIVGVLGFRAYLKDKKYYIEYTDKDYVSQFKD